MIGTQQRSDLQHAIEDACERLVTMVVNAPDLNVRVPDTPNWTARQAFAHVVTVTPRYTAGARQTGRWVDAWPHHAAGRDRRPRTEQGILRISHQANCLSGTARWLLSYRRLLVCQVSGGSRAFGTSCVSTPAGARMPFHLPRRCLFVIATTACLVVTTPVPE